MYILEIYTHNFIFNLMNKFFAQTKFCWHNNVYHEYLSQKFIKKDITVIWISYKLYLYHRNTWYILYIKTYTLSILQNKQLYVIFFSTKKLSK